MNILEEEKSDQGRFDRDLLAANFANLTLIFMIGLFLIYLWLAGVFKRSDYNTLSLLLGIWMILWGVKLLDLNVEDTKYNFYIQLPEWINCIVPLARCEDGGFESITIIHFIGYFIIGLIVPNLYAEILLLSVGFEVFESLIGFTPKIILDPSINILGYTLGSSMSNSSKS